MGSAASFDLGASIEEASPEELVTAFTGSRASKMKEEPVAYQCVGKGHRRVRSTCPSFFESSLHERQWVRFIFDVSIMEEIRHWRRHGPCLT